MSVVAAVKRVVPQPLHRQLGMVRRWLRTVPPQTRLQKERLLADPSLSSRDRDLLGKVSARISRHDGMYTGNGRHYYAVGLSAINGIDEALERGGPKAVRSILDFPCGSGRVLRFLVHRFPDAEITACELERGPVEFCARTFGVRPALSSVNLDEVSLGRRFDLIWCGSLMTHVNARGVAALLRLFDRHLAAGGLVVFTTHGDFVHGRIPAHSEYGLTPEQVRRMTADYRRTGFGFEDYPGARDYGVSLTSPEWIRARVREVGTLREVLFKERGWDHHQDVFGFVRE